MIKKLLCIVVLIAIATAVNTTLAQDDKAPATVIITDVLNNGNTVNSTSTIYQNIEGVTESSAAVYSLNASGGNGAIQLRAVNKNSGIVTTTSGGVLRKVTVTFNNATQNGRTLEVYAKNTPYEAPTDLYDADKQGTKVASLVYAEGDFTYSYAFEGDYEFIGLRSSIGALWADEIKIDWECDVAELYFRSSLNNWDTSMKFETIDNVNYTLVVNDEIPAGTEFKIANVDWSKSYTYTEAEIRSNVEYTFVDGDGGMDNNAKTAEEIAAGIKITFNVETGAFRIEVSTDIDVPATAITTDVLNNGNTVNSTSTNYQNIEGVTESSAAVYSLNAAGGNGAIQLRTANSNSGIVTTTSGGVLRKVTVTFNNATQNGRTLEVYAKNTPYEAPTDLYDADKQGKKVASLVYAEGDFTYSYAFEGDYEYIGLRSSNAAMWIDEIKIEWECDVTELYFRSSLNDWGTSMMFETSDNVNYTLRVDNEIPAGTEFKIANVDWSTTYSYIEAEILFDVEYIFIDGKDDVKNAKIAEKIPAGANILFNTATGAFKIDDPAWIDAIDAEDGAEYYNMQGIRLDAPTIGKPCIRVFKGAANTVIIK